MTYDGPNRVIFITNKPIFPGGPVASWAVLLANERNRTLVAAVGELA